MKKVFTKYDQILLKIVVPVIKPIAQKLLEDGTSINIIDLLCENHDYVITNIEEGLEGVKFIDYEEVKADTLPLNPPDTQGSRDWVHKA